MIVGKLKALVAGKSFAITVCKLLSINIASKHFGMMYVRCILEKYLQFSLWHNLSNKNNLQ